MNREEALRLLAREPVFWSRIGFGYDPPRTRNGHHIIFNENYAEYRRVHDDFTRAGIRVHTCILSSGWIGVDQYDYEAVDRTLDGLLKGAPDRLFIPRIKLNVPADWCRENPEEVFVYYGGPETAEEIAAMANTPKHDWFGFDCASGYPVNGGTGFVDDRPNVGGMIGLQSFSSKKWLHDAGIALERLIEYLENGPYAEQIIGYHVAFGCCGETTQWGAWREGGENRRGDYGISHRRDFIDWAKARYQGEDGLRAAWELGGETELYAVRVPEPNARETHGDSLEDDFYAHCRIMRDYNAFLSERDADAIEYFGRIVHEKTGKLSGAFYGYLMVPQCAYSGHLAVERILHSPHVDFLCSPKAYSFHTVGEPGGEQSLSRSYNRKKLWLDEVDNRTHLERRGTADMTHSMEETLTVLWRECMKNLTSNQNFWWMDLGEGWFDDPEIMRNIAEMYRLQRELSETPQRSNSEVLLILDEDAQMNGRVSYGRNEGLRKRFDREAKLAGVSVDMFRLKDMLDMPLEQYKVIAFLDTTFLPDALWARVQPRLRRGVTLLWNYACGIQSPDYDLGHVERLTGFAIRQGTGYSQWMYDDAAKDFTPIRVCPGEGVRPVRCAPDGIVCAERTREDGGLSVFACEPMMHTDELRDLFDRSGVHRYLDAPCTVYADNRVVSLFSHETDIHERLRLPERMTLVDCLTGERFEDVTELTIDLPARRMKVFRRVN